MTMLLKIIQRSAWENAKSNVMCIEIIKTHQFQYGTVKGKKPPYGNLQQGFGQ